jgi:predicted transcriptional regulator
MQDQPIEEERVEDRLSEEDHDKCVLHLLLDYSPWTVSEIVRELDGNRLAACDAITRLAGAGLVNRLGQFVFVARTARRADEIENS